MYKTRITRKCFSTLAATACFLFSSVAFAQYESRTSGDWTSVERWKEMKTNVGILAGYSDVEKDYKQSLEYGVDAAMQPWGAYGAGAELSTSRTDTESRSSALTRTKLLARGTYNLGSISNNLPVIRDSYAGVALGPVLDSAGSSNDLRIGVAPVLGFDIPITRTAADKAVSLGLNAKYLLVSGSAPSQLSMAGMVKYWF